MLEADERDTTEHRHTTELRPCAPLGQCVHQMPQASSKKRPGKVHQTETCIGRKLGQSIAKMATLGVQKRLGQPIAKMPTLSVWRLLSGTILKCISSIK